MGLSYRTTFEITKTNSFTLKYQKYTYNVHFRLPSHLIAAAEQFVATAAINFVKRC